MAELMDSTNLLKPEDGDLESNKNAAKGRPKQPWKAEYVKSIVYAGLDAIVTCFSLISSISAGRLSSADVLVLGFANLVADGISMGFSDYVSSSTEMDVAIKERAVTAWEVSHYGGPQMLDLLQCYQALGMEHDDAMTVVNIFAKYKDIMIDEKMTRQKGVLLPDNSQKPWKKGLLTFAAFIVFGSAPLVSFIILIPFTDDNSVKFAGACILSALALALLGMGKAKFAGQEKYAFSAVITVLNGAAAGSVAYVVGWTLRNVAGLED